MTLTRPAPPVWFLNDDGSYTRHAPQPGVVPTSDLGLEPGELVRHHAHHEAGHAVLALLLGIPIVRATVVSTGNYTGHVQLADGWSAPWWSYASMMAAGERASARWLHENNLATPERLWSDELFCWDDRWKVANIAPQTFHLVYGTQDTPEGRHRVDYAELQQFADLLLAAHWQETGNLAAALVDELELSSEEISEVAGIRPVTVPPQQ